MKKEKFPPKKPWHLVQAHAEVTTIGRWARQQRLTNFAPRLEWVARLIKEEINKQASGRMAGSGQEPPVTETREARRDAKPRA
jgi:hypothetical protein